MKNCLLVLFFTSLSFSSEAGICYSLKGITGKVAEAIMKKDYSIYAALYDEELYLNVIRNDSTLGENRKYILNNLETRKALHQEKFNELIGALEERVGKVTFRIKMRPAKILDEFPTEGPVKYFNVQLDFQVNRVAFQLLTIISEYKRCYYFFEAISGEPQEVKK